MDWISEGRRVSISLGKTDWRSVGIGISVGIDSGMLNSDCKSVGIATSVGTVIGTVGMIDWISEGRRD